MLIQYTRSTLIEAVDPQNLDAPVYAMADDHDILFPDDNTLQRDLQKFQGVKVLANCRTYSGLRQLP